MIRGYTEPLLCDTAHSTTVAEFILVDQCCRSESLLSQVLMSEKE